MKRKIRVWGSGKNEGKKKKYKINNEFSRASIRSRPKSYALYSLR